MTECNMKFMDIFNIRIFFLQLQSGVKKGELEIFRNIF